MSAPADTPPLPRMPGDEDPGRFVGWQKDDKDREAQYQIARRAREQYERSRPTTKELEACVRQHLHHMQENQHRRIDGIEDPVERREVELLARLTENNETRCGDTVEGIIAVVQETFPGTPWERARSIIDKLEQNGQIYTDAKQSGRWKQPIVRLKLKTITPPPAAARTEPPEEDLPPARHSPSGGTNEVTRPNDRPALSENATAVYEILLALPTYQAMTGARLLDALHKRDVYIEQSTLTSRIIPELKPYGIENCQRKGYRIPLSKRSTG